jgi:hypothetical protein
MTLAGVPAPVGYDVSDMEPYLTHAVPYDERSIPRSKRCASSSGRRPTWALGKGAKVREIPMCRRRDETRWPSSSVLPRARV